MYVSLFGGLANVLIQIAFGHAIGSTHNVKIRYFFADPRPSKSHEKFAKDFISARQDVLDGPSAALLRLMRRASSAAERWTNLAVPGYLSERRMVKAKGLGVRLLDGYWQRPHYWPGGLGELYDHIPPHLLHAVFGAPNQSLVPRLAVHIRGGDYLNGVTAARHNIINVDQLISASTSFAEGLPITLVTDDTAFAARIAELFPGKAPAIQSGSALDDACFIATSCRVLTANSTFSVLSAETARRRGAVCLSPAIWTNDSVYTFVELPWDRY